MKGSREQSVLRYFKEADLEIAEVIHEAGSRILKRRQQESSSPTLQSTSTKKKGKGKAKGAAAGSTNGPAGSTLNERDYDSSVGP